VVIYLFQIFSVMNSASSSHTLKKLVLSKRLPLLLFRVILGLALFYKGISFIYNAVILEQIFSETDFLSKISLLQFIIPWAHIIGGFFILIGIYTRTSIIVQLPIVLGAIVVLLNSSKNNSLYSAEMIFAVVILILMIVYLKLGGGFYSWNQLIKKEKEII